MTDVVRLERPEPAIAWLQIDRPEARNALTVPMWRHLGELIEGVARDTAVRALVLCGNADAFIAGADIVDFGRMRDAADGLAYEAVVETTLAKLEALEIPTIAAISGACTGGGTVLASACDVRLATIDARIGVPIARTVGNITTAKNLARLSAAAGRPRALAWILTAELSRAGDLVASGFVLDTAPDYAALRVRAHELARTMAANAPLTLAAAKELMRRIGPALANVADADQLERCYGSADFREGVAAFASKRRARFEGR